MSSERCGVGVQAVPLLAGSAVVGAGARCRWRAPLPGRRQQAADAAQARVRAPANVGGFIVVLAVGVQVPTA
ncbi:hypothetical protein ASF16_17845 [Acidovorax sp. Leaf78]|nr:hypothetical protein ASF16_17845 [Acidovorax sp. Leaf78]